jgi:release factor glutamine methyltransferase
VDDVYSPAEDSYLLARWVQRLAVGRVLDVGTGSGIQAVTAALKPEVVNVVAVDLDLRALEAAKGRAKAAGVEEKLTLLMSDLFENVEGVFDWIVFNPPYLPSEEGIRDPAWDGGEGGAALIRRFLSEAKSHLAREGSILLILSSETDTPREGFGYSWILLEEAPLFFERLGCYRLTPT